MQRLGPCEKLNRSAHVREAAQDHVGDHHLELVQAGVEGVHDAFLADLARMSLGAERVP